MPITTDSCRPRTYLSSGKSESASIIGSSVVPGLPKRCVTPSSTSSWRKAFRPVIIESAPTPRYVAVTWRSARSSSCLPSKATARIVDHVHAVRELQLHLGVLLDEQHAHTFVLHLADGVHHRVDHPGREADAARARPGAGGRVGRRGELHPSPAPLGRGHGGCAAAPCANSLIPPEGAHH